MSGAAPTKKTLESYEYSVNVDSSEHILPKWKSSLDSSDSSAHVEVPGEIIEEEPDPIEIDDVSLQGTIQNEFGQRLPGVTVQFYNQAGNAETTITDEEGYFSFQDLDQLTESFRLVCQKEDYHLGLINMEIEELITSSEIDVIMFSDITGTGAVDIGNPFDHDFLLVQGQIQNYDVQNGFIFFEALSDFGEFLSFGFADQNGMFQLWIPPGQGFLLIAQDACHNIIYIEQFQSISDPVMDLQIQTSLPQGSELIEVFGTINDCFTGEPLEEGTLLVSFNQSFHQEVYVENGNFEFQIFECLAGSSIEIYPQFNSSNPLPIYIEATDLIGNDAWNLGQLTFCDEISGGSSSIIINGTDSLSVDALNAIHFGEQLYIFSDVFIAELDVEEDEILGFKSIMVHLNDFTQYFSQSVNSINIDVEVENYTGEPGSNLIMNFGGSFIDADSFQQITIEGQLDVLVF